MQSRYAANGRASPVKELLDWELGAPGAAEYAHARQVRAQQAADLRRSYDQQIQEKHEMEDVYLAAESKWPYGPQHRPESKCAYLSSPRYVKPTFVQAGVKL